MSEPRAFHNAVLLRNGKVLIVGGPGSSAELYDPLSGTFTRTGAVVEPQMYGTATLLNDGQVLIAAAFGNCVDCVATAELYDPLTGTFKNTGPYAATGQSLQYGLTGATATLLQDGRVLIAAEPYGQIYDPKTQTFSLTSTMDAVQTRFGRPGYIAGRTATLLPDGRVLLAGGEHEDLGRFDNVELFEPSSSRFTATANMSTLRTLHTATLLPGGKVLVAGGEGVEGNCVVSQQTTEIYDPTTRTFTTAAAMQAKREGQQATVLADGSVLITGGESFHGGLPPCTVSWNTLASAELYTASNH
jgi:hypothetical protein